MAKNTFALDHRNVSFGVISRAARLLGHVRFSNRPFGVKRLQATRHSSVDVARGLALLFGLGTKALPSWDSRIRRNNLFAPPRDDFLRGGKPAYMSER